MKTPKLLSVTIIVVAAFSFACNSLLKSFPTSGLSNQKTDLVSLLPSSDMVMKINSKRLLNDSVPQFLSLVPEAAAKYNEQIKELPSKSGIDPQSVDEIVVGWTYKSGKPTSMDEVDFVALARGSFDSNALLKASKQSAKGQVREETIEGKIVYIIDTSAQLNKQNDLNKNFGENSFAEEALANKFKVDELAMVSLDSNTVAFAKPLQIRSLLSENKTALNPVLIELLNRHPGAAINFAIDSSFQQNLMSSSLSKGSAAEAPKMRESLVSLDFDNNGLSVDLAAMTLQEDDAKKLEDSFMKMQASMKQMLGSATDETSQVIVRTVDNFKFTRNATEVQFEAKIPKNDLEKIFKGYAPFLTAMFASNLAQSAGTSDLPPPPPKPAKKSLSNKY